MNSADSRPGQGPAISEAGRGFLLQHATGANLHRRICGWPVSKPEGKRVPHTSVCASPGFETGSAHTEVCATRFVPGSERLSKSVVGIKGGQRL